MTARKSKHAFPVGTSVQVTQAAITLGRGMGRVPLKRFSGRVGRVCDHTTSGRPVVLFGNHKKMRPIKTTFENQQLEKAPEPDPTERDWDE